MEIDNILAKVNGTAVEEDQEETTTPDSPSDKEEEQEEPSQEGEESTGEVTTDDSEDDNTPSEDNVPFHKHPRWKQKQEEIELLKEQVESLKANTIKEEPKLNAGDEPLPQWVLGLAGGQDTPEARVWYKQYQKETAEDRNRIKQEAVAEIKQELEKKEKEVEKWNSWVEEETSRVLEGEKGITKNELLKVANDFQPVDEKGNISFEKALQIVKMQKSSKGDKAEAKKKIASSTTSKQGGSSPNNQVNTPHSLRNQDIFDIAR